MEIEIVAYVYHCLIMLVSCHLSSVFYFFRGEDHLDFWMNYFRTKFWDVYSTKVSVGIKFVFSHLFKLFLYLTRKYFDVRSFEISNLWTFIS